MITLTAKVFLITISIFAIAIKRIFIIAFWALNWYNFLHEDFILSGRYLFSGKNIVPQRIEVLNFHLSLQSAEENIGGFIMEYSDFGLIQGIVGHRLVENQIHLKKNFALNFQVQYYVSLYHQEQP